jgi:hypothetical protein
LATLLCFINAFINVPNIFVLTVYVTLLNFVFKIVPLLKSLLALVLHCSDYFHSLDSDPVTTAIYPVSSELEVLNTVHLHAVK